MRMGMTGTIVTDEKMPGMRMGMRLGLWKRREKIERKNNGSIRMMFNDDKKIWNGCNKKNKYLPEKRGRFFIFYDQNDGYMLRNIYIGADRYWLWNG